MKQNTISFQKEFAHVYQEFFGKCNTVVSTDCTLWLTWGAGWRVGAPVVVQKTPYRFYVGIEKNDQNEVIEQGTSTVFDTRTETFGSVDDSLISWKDSIPIFRDLIKRKTGSDSFAGIRIHLLSEQPFYTADAPDVSIGIICALYIHFGFMDSRQLQELIALSGFELWKLTNSKTALFREMHQAAMKIIEVTTGGRACGDEIYASFVCGETPFVYSIDPTPDCNRIIGCSLQELADIHGSIPLDVLSIDVGQGFLWPNRNFDFGNYIRRALGKLQVRITQLFDSAKFGFEPPDFVKRIDEQDSYWKLFCESSVLRSIHFLDCLIALYREPARNTAILECLESIESISTTNTPFEELPSSHMQHIVRELKDLAERNGVSLGCLFVCSGKTEGNILVFMQQHTLRNEIFETIEDLKLSYDSNIAVGFVSWRDGWGTGEGCKIEQSEREGIFSTFLNTSLKKIMFDESGKSSITSIPQGNIDPKSADIVIDAINNEIYVGGKTVDSKKLPTKKATIDLFKNILEVSSHSLRNKELKRSVYTTSRNDMQGKIIGPLVRLVADELKKDFYLKVEGELMNFFVTWKPGVVSLILISKF